MEKVYVPFKMIEGTTSASDVGEMKRALGHVSLLADASKRHRGADSEESETNWKCSANAISQFQSTCYMVAPFMLVMKVRTLFNAVNSHMQAFVKSAMIDADVCSKVPMEVQDKYKEFSGLEMTVKSGGSAVALLRAILTDSELSYQFGTFTLSTRRANAYPLAEPVRQWVLESTKCEGKEAYVLNFRILGILSPIEAVAFIQRLHCQVPVTLEGGILNLIRKKKGKDRKHAVAFTMCKGQVNLCNWGHCKMHNHFPFDASLPPCAPPLAGTGYDVFGVCVVMTRPSHISCIPVHAD